MAKKETNKIKCRVCLSEKVATRDFYSSKSELYNSIGRMDICKDCIQLRYDKLLTLYDGNSINSFRHLLMNLDVFYDEELYMECMKSDSFIGEYFRQVNGTKVRKNKTSMDNLLRGEVNENKIALNDGGTISDDLIVRWGKGRNKEDYLILEKRYSQMINDYPSESPEEKLLIRILCQLENDIDECRLTDKKSIPSLENVRSKKMEELGVIPTKQKRYDKDSQLIYGMMVKTYENERPIPEVLDIYKDIDGIHRYWNRNLIYPMALAEDMAEGNYDVEKGADITLNPEIRKFMEDDVDEK